MRQVPALDRVVDSAFLSDLKPLHVHSIDDIDNYEDSL